MTTRKNTSPTGKRNVTTRFEAVCCKACGRKVKRRSRQQLYCSDRCQEWSRRPRARRENAASQINSRTAFKNSAGHQGSGAPGNHPFLSNKNNSLRVGKSRSSIPLNVLGGYARAFEGAYFAKALELARQQERIGHVAVDPVLPVKAFFDIGGAGHSSDAMAIWIAQFVGREIRLLDYIEGVGQPLGYYAHELRRRGWNDVIVYLPHDGVATNNITGKRYIDHWTEAGFECGIPIKNTKQTTMRQVCDGGLGAGN